MRIIGLLFLVMCVVAASAQPHTPLVYHGGPVLTSFKIYPLFYGPWSSTDMSAQQNYLVGLARYLSGDFAPAGQIPTLRQYGVISVSVAPAATASATSPATLSGSDIMPIIRANQTSGKLPAFGPHTLILLFLAHGINVSGACGFHAATSADVFYGLVNADCGPWLLLTMHEVMEAATDPADTGSANGWDEAVDNCVTSFNIASVGPMVGPADNAAGGWCATSGYTPAVTPNQQYGYVWANDPSAASYTPSTTFQYNSSGALNTVTRSGTGIYDVKFPGLVHLVVGGTVSVTAYGGGNETCKVFNWNEIGWDMVARVMCFTPGGAPIDTRFVASFTNTRVFSDSAYVWANNMTTPSYAPLLTYQSSPYKSPITISRAGTGNYTVLIPSMTQNSLNDPHGGGGTVIATAYGSDGTSCNVGSWSQAGADASVNVRCFNSSGAPADSQFSMTYHRKTDLLGRFSNNHAFVWANAPFSASYTPSANFQFNTQPGDLTISRTGTGVYTVSVPNQAQTGGSVQVTGYGTAATHCKVESWGPSGANQAINVRCFNASGAAADEYFTMSYTAP